MVNLGSSCGYSVWTATVDWVRIPSTFYTHNGINADSHFRNEGTIFIAAFNSSQNSFSGLITVANLFEPSVDGKVTGSVCFTYSQRIYFIAAVSCIKAQIEASHGIIRVCTLLVLILGSFSKPYLQSVFVVGGYAASPWLFG
jgi:hypothetical protein